MISMQDFWGRLMIASFCLLIIGLIKPKFILRWGNEKIRNRKFIAIIFIPLTILFAIGVGSNGPDTPKVENTPQITPQTENTPTSYLGSLTTDFDKIYGKPTQSDTDKEFHSYKYLNGKIEVRDNFKSPAKAECIILDLRKRDNNDKLISPEIYPVQTSKDLDKAIQKFLPPDAHLVKELAFQDLSLKQPISQIKIYRLYESKWLADNFKPLDAESSLPNNQFWVITNKLDGGYMDALIGVNLTDWEDTEEGYLEQTGWSKVDIPQ